MGCGASSVRTSPGTSNHRGSSAQAKANGTLATKVATTSGSSNSKSRRNSDDSKKSLSSSSSVSSSSEAINGSESPSSKRKQQLKRQLSSIDEGGDLVLRHQIAIQTDLESVHGIKSQYVQTELELNPEDELELLMNEDNLDSDEEAAPSDGLSEGEADTLSSGDAMSRDLNASDANSKADVGVQVKRLRAFSTQTRLTVLHGKTSLFSRRNPLMVTRDGPTVSTSVVAKPRRREPQPPRLRTAPPKAEDIEQADFESQTDPISQALAANAADSDLNVLHSYEISSPFSHIEKELSAVDKEGLVQTKGKRNFDVRLQECLNKLLDDMEDSFGTQKAVQKRDASVQTYNDPITDEAPEYAARPPPTRKKEMIPSLALFKEVDRRAVECPPDVVTSLPTLVEYLCLNASNDLFKVRAIFRWIAHNIKYDWKYMGVTLTPSEVLRLGEGVCKDYCLLFGDMCRQAGLRVKKIQGFAKGHEYRPGYQFKPGEDIAHNWNAVYILGSWRFVDSTWGTGYTDHSGKFQRKLNEHFFLTDPEVLIWSHFPFDENESDYSRWQLLDKELSLQEFNGLPKVTPFYFEFNLKVRTKLQNPIEFRVQTEIRIGAHEPMRYKYKLYPTDEVENSSLNHYAFCQLKEDRMVGSFVVTPPIEGRYFLKVYTKPEREMLEGATDSSSLHSVVTFLLECNRARKYIEPFPLNELPWGPTQAFFDFKMKIHNQMGPIISSWGGKRKLTIESVETMLITNQIFDSEGMELDIRTIVLREENGLKISFTISPPRVGMFKFMLFGMPKPKQKGKWRLPLLATFLVDCKLAKLPPQEEDPPPMPANAVPAADSVAGPSRAVRK